METKFESFMQERFSSFGKKGVLFVLESKCLYEEPFSITKNNAWKTKHQTN
jgi:hypothetical protein